MKTLKMLARAALWPHTIGLAFLSLLPLSAAFAQNTAKPPPLANDNPPFLSACAEKPGALSWTTRHRWVYRPASARPAKLFYDVPFALNVPVDVRFNEGVVRISYSISVEWENPPEFWQGSRAMSGADYGLYAMDGKELPAGSVFEASSLSADSKTWRSLVLDAEGEIRTWTFPWQTNAANRERQSSFTISQATGAHVPFKAPRNAFVLAPARAGSYALWFAIDLGNSWPNQEPEREEIKGRFRVDVLVSRGERHVPENEVAYLFGRGARPPGMPEDKLFVASSFQVPFTVHRDGWMFDYAEARPMQRIAREPQSQFPVYGYSPTNAEAASSSSVNGPQVHLQLKVASWNGRIGGVYGRGVPTSVFYREDNRWTVSLPEFVPDYGFATMSASGGKDRWYDFNNTSRRYKTWEEVDRVVDPSRFVAQWMPQWQSATGTNKRAYVEFAWQTQAESSRNYLSGRRAEFIRSYGTNAEPFWFDDYRERTDLGENGAAGSFRFLVRGRPVHEQDRGALIQRCESYPIMAWDVGPWRVVGYYRRASCPEKPGSGSRPAPGGSSVVQEADPFWKWYPGLSRLIKERMEKVALAKADAGMEALPLEELVKSVQRLTADLIPDELAPDASFGQRTVRAIENAADNSQRLTPSDAQWQRRLALLRKRTAEIRERRQALDRSIVEAQAAFDDILAKFDEGIAQFSDRHPQLLLWKRQYRQARERIPFEIAFLSKDLETMRKALADAELLALSANTRLLEAEIHRASGDPVSALYALRSAATVAPDDPVVAQKLTDAECAFLKTAIDKSQGTIQQARAAFYGYLLERGFSDRDHRVEGGSTLQYVANWSVSSAQSFAEDAWAAFTTGLFGSFSAFYGKPAAQADLLATTERQMTTAFIGLNTMLRLRARGHTFEQIKKMTSAELRDKLPLRDLHGAPYSLHQAQLHSVAVREAMKLPDVAALMTDDKLGLQLGLTEKYWDPRDVGDTWIEWIGDTTSAFNLITLMPAAKVGMTGRAGLLWTEADIAMMQQLERLGTVMSGTEVIANTIGLTRLLGAAGATDSGKRLISWMRAAARYQEQLGLADKAIWTSGKLMGLITIQTVTFLATEEIAGHKAAMLVSAALMFGTDSDLLMKLLKSRGIPPEKVGALIVSEYLPGARAHIKRLAAMEKTGGELRSLFERVKSGQPLSPADHAFLNKHFREEWRTLVPNGQPSHDATIALRAAGQSAAGGSDTGALQAFEDLQPQIRKETEDTVAAAAQAEALTVALKPNAPPPPRPNDLPSFVDKPGRMLPTIRYAATDASYPRGKLPLPPIPKLGSECAEAEALLHAGKYREAESKFVRVIERISKKEVLEVNELPMEHICLKRALAAELQQTKRLTPSAASKAINHPVSAEDLDFAINHPEKWKPLSTQGAVGEVFAVEGRDDLIVKVVKPKLILPEVDAEANVLHADLAHALGLDTPGLNVRLVYNDQNSVAQAVHVMRRVHGTELRAKSAAEIFLLKEELSRHRALAVVLGDYDRHVANYMVTPDGRLCAIDAGLTDLVAPRFQPVDGPMVMKGAVGRDHWYSRYYKDDLKHGPGAPVIDLWSPKEEFSRKGLVAEQALTWEAARPTVEAVETLAQDEPRLRKLIEGSLRKLYDTEAERVRLRLRLLDLEQVPAASRNDAELLQRYDQRVRQSMEAKIGGKLETAVNTFKARAKHLRETMQGLNERNALPLSASIDIRHLFDQPTEGRIIPFAAWIPEEGRLAA